MISSGIYVFYHLPSIINHDLNWNDTTRYMAAKRKPVCHVNATKLDLHSGCFAGNAILCLNFFLSFFFFFFNKIELFDFRPELNLELCFTCISAYSYQSVK